MSRIGICVICFPAHKAGMPLGMIGRNKDRNDKTQNFIPCKACNGNGFARFRSDK